MKNIVLIFLVMISLSVLGQEIENGSFEDFEQSSSSCKADHAFVTPTCLGGPWEASHGTPDVSDNYYGGSNPWNWGTDPGHNYARAKSFGGKGVGNGKEGIMYPYEFKNGETYTIEFDMKIFAYDQKDGTSTEDNLRDVEWVILRLLRSNDISANTNTSDSQASLPSKLFRNPIGFSDFQQIPNKGGYIAEDDRFDWRHFSYTFEASESWGKIIFYPIHRNNWEGAYMGLDNVSISCNEYQCQDDVIIDNPVAVPPFVAANNSITVNQLNVLDGQSIEMNAGNVITLNPGFFAEPGSVVSTNLVPCSEINNKPGQANIEVIPLGCGFRLQPCACSAKGDDYIYEWSPNLGNSESIVVYPITTTSYQLKMTNGNQVYYGQVVVAPPVEPSLTVTDFGCGRRVRVNICDAGNSDVAYQWTANGIPFSTSKEIIDDRIFQIDYELTITDQLTGQTIILTYTSEPIPNAVYEQDLECGKRLNTCNVSGNVLSEWTWSGGSSSETEIIVDGVGTGQLYNLTVQNEITGEFAFGLENVDFELPAIRVNGNCSKELIVSTCDLDNVSYEWFSESGNLIGTERVLSIANYSAQEFTVIVSDATTSQTATASLVADPDRFFGDPTFPEDPIGGFCPQSNVWFPGSNVAGENAYNLTSYAFRVYNRFGNEVFDSRWNHGSPGFAQEEISWDGKRNGQYMPAGDYWVVLDGTNCSGYFGGIIDPNNFTLTIGCGLKVEELGDELSKVELILYPEPVGDVVHLNFSSGHYRVISLSGALIKSGLISQTGIDVSGLKAGRYVLEVKTSEDVHRKLFSKVD